jgi:hypothetical protein
MSEQDQGPVETDEVKQLVNLLQYQRLYREPCTAEEQRRDGDAICLR